MKSYIKKSFLLPMLAILLIMQSTGLSSSVAKDAGFLAGYLWGTGVGACALAGSYIIFNPVIQRMRARATQLYSSFYYIQPLRSNCHLDGYVGAVPQEVADLIAQLKSPVEYLKMRVKLAKGLIFFGPPGSGKTQLARSVAAAVNCPFFAANATDFKQEFIGKGKDAVKELFEKARNGAREHSSRTAIIFIDEFDSVDRRVSGVHDNGRSEVINTLLNEMDGFNSHDDIRVVVIAATNFLDAIDPALRRSGRFDYKIYIPYPDMHGRALFIQKFLQAYPTDASVSYENLVKETEGMSPADIVFLFELAGRIAIRSKKETRDRSCFQEALKQIRLMI